MWLSFFFFFVDIVLFNSSALVSRDLVNVAADHHPCHGTSYAFTRLLELFRFDDLRFEDPLLELESPLKSDLARNLKKPLYFPRMPPRRVL